RRGAHAGGNARQPLGGGLRRLGARGRFRLGCAGGFCSQGNGDRRTDVRDIELRFSFEGYLSGAIEGGQGPFSEVGRAEDAVECARFPLFSTFLLDTFLRLPSQSFYESSVALRGPLTKLSTAYLVKFVAEPVLFICH